MANGEIFRTKMAFIAFFLVSTQATDPGIRLGTPDEDLQYDPKVRRVTGAGTNFKTTPNDKEVFVGESVQFDWDYIDLQDVYDVSFGVLLPTTDSETFEEVAICVKKRDGTLIFNMHQSIKWIRDKVEVVPGRRASFKIKSVEMDDSKTFFCKLVTPSVTVENTVKLTVLGKDDSHDGRDGKSCLKDLCGSCSECLTGFHLFEKVQDLPTRGAETVVHFTIDGRLFLAFANIVGDINKGKTNSTIYEMDDSTGQFTFYQTLPTRGPNDMKFFTIEDKHFLAVTNHYDGTHLLDSVIYQWNGNQFVVFQKIPTKGGCHFTFFTINGEGYLTVANFYDEITFSIKSVIYKWSGGKFNKFQEIATEGAAGCTSFVINNNTFLAFANMGTFQPKYSARSTVYKWLGGYFVKVQSLQTYGADDVKSFHINDHTFLAFANYYCGSSYNMDSFIYKWDGKKFVLFQSIPTRGARTLYPFVISGQTFLGVANSYDDLHRENTQSVVYQASGARFVKYQEIPTHGGWDMTSFKYKGHTYLAVANRSNGKKHNIDSALYKWI